MTGPMQHYLEHPMDVLGQWLDWQARGRAALVVITHTEGGAVRNTGALMAVTEDGRAAGYISGGCLDADIILQARQAIEAGETRQLRYGAGSPFIDLPLPCGGAIEVAVLPSPDTAQIQVAHDRLSRRLPATLEIEAAGLTAHYTPALRLRIAGRGADPLALARLARASGLETTLQLRDGEDVTAARDEGFDNVQALELPSDLPDHDDDPWTAFVLMFHDADWEGPLLEQALAGRAFYVGAVGSRKTHARRCEMLKAQGVAATEIARVRGPVGLIPSMRDASMLATSVLAEIISALHSPGRQVFERTSAVMLAAGAATRFEDGDKLLALHAGKPLIQHAASTLRTEPLARRVAVTAPGHPARRDALEAAGWSITENPNPDDGQASSLRCGLKAAFASPGIDYALITLADMPGVPDAHLVALATAMAEGKTAVMTESDGVLSPPAMFHRDHLEELMRLDGDKGAKSVFKRLDNTVTVPLDPAFAFDVDTRSDLATVEEATHA